MSINNQYFNVEGNKFDFKITTALSCDEWYVQGFEIVVKNQDVYLRVDKMKKDRYYKIDFLEFIYELFNMYFMPDENFKFTFEQIKIACNTNPTFARDLYLDCVWNLKARKKD